MAKAIRVGSRESKLAVVQSEIIIARLKEQYPEQEFELITMKTTGDIVLDKSLDTIGGKGLFIGELDRALLSGKIDFAVHSLKDIPMQLEPGIIISAYSKREDARDALILPQGTPADRTKPIGCSGLRRKLRISELYPDWEAADIRGNVLTRLKKLDSGEYGGLILAVAGLKRLGLENRISRVFEPDEMLPAAGQGIMAVVTREDSPCEITAAADDKGSRYCALAERAFVRRLDGGCNLPIAAYAVISGGDVRLTGLYSAGIDGRYVAGEIVGKASECEELGKTLATELLLKYEQQDDR